MPPKPANESVKNAQLWHVYAAAATEADLSAPATFAGIGKCPVAFVPLAAGTVVVKRQIDDTNETVAAPAGMRVNGQCSALVSTDVAVIFYW